jgi:Pentapeptide repeats (9 copies)
MAAEQPDWEPCSQDGCIGVRLSTVAWCLAHAAEQAPAAFDAELKRISAEGTVDARGVLISADLLVRLLDATPRKDDRPTFTAARFDGASFQGEAGFDRASFQDRAGFEEASFQGAAVFGGTSFQGEAGFDRASFQDVARFDRASFEDVGRFVVSCVRILETGETWPLTCPTEESC